MRANGRSVYKCVCICAIVLFAISAMEASAQREAAGGGYAKAYEGAGSSPAAQTVRKNVGGALQKAAARARAKRNAATASNAARRPQPSRGTPTQQRTPITRPAGTTNFKPVSSANTIETLAESIGTTPEEKELLKQIFAATKTAFEKEVATKGRPNNISAAFTFFIGTMAMVYHDDPEPSEEALDNLWDGLDEVLAELPEMAQMSDGDKQEMYDTLLSFSGLVLAGHMNGKETNDAATQQAYRVLAGTLIQTVLQISPDGVRFGRDGLNIGS